MTYPHKLFLRCPKLHLLSKASDHSFLLSSFNMRCVCMSFVFIMLKDIWLISISFHFIISKLLESYEHNISKSLTKDMSSSAKLELSTFFSTKKNLQRWILKILFISAFFIVYLCEFVFFYWHLLETRHSSQIFEAVLNANLILKKNYFNTRKPKNNQLKTW